jgi:serine phosphatase RsbU (regulator of sigma subunit)
MNTTIAVPISLNLHFMRPDLALADQRKKIKLCITKLILSVLIIVLTMSNPGKAQFTIKIDAQKDKFYELLTGSENGHIFIPHSDFLPLSGPKPDGDFDISANVWVAWDENYFYLYAEVNDDVVKVNNRFHPENDCIELKFDPDPIKKALAGIVNARLSALDSLEAENARGVDNLYSEGNLAPEAVSPDNYARRLTNSGYVLEVRLAWKWIKIKDRVVNVGVGERFGFAINFHDNDSDGRDGSIQWSPTMADEVWNTPQLLGTIEFMEDNKLKFIRQNSIDPNASMGKTYLSLDRFTERPEKALRFENWKYHSGDDSEWANPKYDDKSWDATCPCILSNHKPQGGWNGIGWFRIHVWVDSSLWGVPLAFDLKQMGATEVYLDGRLLYTIGDVGQSKEDEKTLIDRNTKYIVFTDQEDHLLAIRHSNFSTDYHNQLGIDAGFSCFIWLDLNSYIAHSTEGIRTATIYQILFTTIPIVLAFLHLFLFIFYPRSIENLYFAICMFCWAIIVFEDFYSPLTTNIQQLLLLESISVLAIIPALVFGLLTTYRSVYKELPKYYKYFIIVGFVSAISIILPLWGLFTSGIKYAGIIFNGYIGIAAFEIFRIYLIKGLKREKERWITGVGFIILMMAIIYQILIGLGYVEPLGGIRVVYVYGILVLSITVSIDLSRSYAKTNRDLENQLVQVQNLSQKTIEQERQAKEEEITRKVLEVDNARKTKELEEARGLQISMLPRKIPGTRRFDIAVQMKTATEVGGDYYDFAQGDDDTLTVAIGDATGHGMKAGTMVVSIKSLFTAYGAHLDIQSFFNKCTEIIKAMHLGKLFMGMLLVRINGSKLIASAAGMPPIFVYRKQRKIVEELVMKGMPLGAHCGFTYQIKHTNLEPGDTLLLMTDGFPELFNEKREMLDYDRVRGLFKRAAPKSAKEIIEHLSKAGEAWSNGRPQDDDYTFVVLKIKDKKRPVSLQAKKVNML